MYLHKITDWDDAYANAPHIPDGTAYPERWAADAEAFRASIQGDLGVAYGAEERQRLDLFRPQLGAPEGLVVFVHGGYWMRFDRSLWSHFAAGPLAAGWAVAMPSYTLCPNVRIGQIVHEVSAAVRTAAQLVDGPVRLIGHSAGGHLVTRLLCADHQIPAGLAGRIAHAVSLSGVHDLRPLLRTAMAGALRLDPAEASAESPALRVPRPGVRLTTWVGGAERAEFRRQSALIANAWTGLGAATACVTEPDRHHFDVLDGLRDADSPLCRILLES